MQTHANAIGVNVTANRSSSVLDRESRRRLSAGRRRGAGEHGVSYASSRRAAGTRHPQIRRAGVVLHLKRLSSRSDCYQAVPLGLQIRIHFFSFQLNTTLFLQHDCSSRLIFSFHL